MVSANRLLAAVCGGLIAIGLLAAAPLPADAALNVDWYSIDAGGITTSGGTLAVHGTIGQPDAHEVAAGAYVLTGGFRGVSHCKMCDVDEDGYVDVVDLLYLVYAFGTARGDSGYHPGCDFNTDGLVDVVDLLWLVDTFGT